jgi:hypothetical protein
MNYKYNPEVFVFGLYHLVEEKAHFLVKTGLIAKKEVKKGQITLLL